MGYDTTSLKKLKMLKNFESERFEIKKDSSRVASRINDKLSDDVR